MKGDKRGAARTPSVSPQVQAKRKAAAMAAPEPQPSTETDAAPAGSPSDELVEVDDTLEDVVDEQLEEAADAHLVDSHMLEEEETLRKEREEKEREEEREQAAAAAEGNGPVRHNKYEKLDELLDKTFLYTSFIDESLKQEKQKAEEAAAKGESSGAAKKRKLAKEADAQKELCPLMKTKLKDYQIEGLKWMVGLYQNGLNGILADQMGLGKTIQTISFLSHLRSMGINGPFIVIAPLSTLANWSNEFKMHCPSISSVIYHGSKAERERLRQEHFSRVSSNEWSTDDDGKRKLNTAVGADYPVMITSYETAMCDTDHLKKWCFKYCIVDEAHRLKNFECKLLRKLREFNIGNKLLLSGTPLQNSLPELWSLLHFILPDVFASLSQFEDWFDFGEIVGSTDLDQSARELAEKERRNEVVSKLHKLLQPFLLRRMKSDVELCLPMKREILLWAQMKPKQKTFDEGLRDKTLGPILSGLAEKNGAATKASGTLNNVLMQMRKNCNHPDLLDGDASGNLEFPPADELEAECGKLALMARLLARLKQNGHRTLIFSQMTKMLDIFESYLDERGVRYCRLDGQTKYEERRARIDEFNDPKGDCFVFLLSTRAGGLGINLTSADTVIIFDSDWNPHVDMQAMDRVHRIGQTKPVHVYRLATAHSVEGKMLKRAQSKLVLEKVVMLQGGFHNKEKVKLNASELVSLFRDDSASDDEKFPQSADISDADLDRLMDRRDMVKGSKIKSLPARGVGYEFVEDKSQKSLLSTIK